MVDSLLFFFFSSRRRHTRCSRDWSSDVCSSDLGAAPATIWSRIRAGGHFSILSSCRWVFLAPSTSARSEEHTSELQSRLHLVCRLLLEKKKKQVYKYSRL